MDLLEICATQGQPELLTSGIIRNVDRPDRILITDVRVQMGSGARFVLGPGRYFYLFHVERGFGVFTLSLRDSSGSDRQFNTAESGAYGLTFPFVVL